MSTILLNSAPYSRIQMIGCTSVMAIQTGWRNSPIR